VPKQFQIILLLIFLLSGCSSYEPDPLFTNKKPLYNKITMEIVSVEGFSPDPSGLKSFEEGLLHYHFCKNLILIQRTTRLKPEYLAPWTRNDLLTFEVINRTILKSENKQELNLFVSFVPGPYIQGKVTGLAGLQYGDSSFVLFKNFTSDCESIVLLHEFGHLMLIADDSHSPNRKPVNADRPNHCNNPQCIMFWRASDNIKDFDLDCRREIAKLLED
jgi:hypothetical protein